MASQREALFAFAKETFGTEPEFLWEKTPDAGVLRHADNRKWYGIVMTVQRKTLGLSGEGAVEILNVKADYLTGSFLRQQAEPSQPLVFLLCSSHYTIVSPFRLSVFP